MRRSTWLGWALLAVVMLSTQSGCRTSMPAGVKTTDPVVANQGDVYPNRD